MKTRNRQHRRKLTTARSATARVVGNDGEQNKIPANLRSYNDCEDSSYWTTPKAIGPERQSRSMSARNVPATISSPISKIRNAPVNRVTNSQTPARRIRKTRSTSSTAKRTQTRTKTSTTTPSTASTNASTEPPRSPIGELRLAEKERALITIQNKFIDQLKRLGHAMVGTIVRCQLMVDNKQETFDGVVAHCPEHGNNDLTIHVYFFDMVKRFDAYINTNGLVTFEDDEKPTVNDIIRSEDTLKLIGTGVRLYVHGNIDEYKNGFVCSIQNKRNNKDKFYNIVIIDDETVIKIPVNTDGQARIQNFNREYCKWYKEHLDPSVTVNFKMQYMNNPKITPNDVIDCSDDITHHTHTNRKKRRSVGSGTEQREKKRTKKKNSVVNVEHKIDVSSIKKKNTFDPTLIYDGFTYAAQDPNYNQVPTENKFLTGYHFAVSGSLRKMNDISDYTHNIQAKSIIKQFGGVVVESISKKTDLLITGGTLYHKRNKKTNGKSYIFGKKYEAAINLNVPIICSLCDFHGLMEMLAREKIETNPYGDEPYQTDTECSSADDSDNIDATFHTLQLKDGVELLFQTDMKNDDLQTCVEKYTEGDDFEEYKPRYSFAFEPTDDVLVTSDNIPDFIFIGYHYLPHNSQTGEEIKIKVSSFVCIVLSILLLWI